MRGQVFVIHGSSFESFDHTKSKNTFDKSRLPRGDALDMYNSLGFRSSHEIVPMLVLGALLIAFY